MHTCCSVQEKHVFVSHFEALKSKGLDHQATKSVGVDQQDFSRIMLIYAVSERSTG